MGKQDIFAWIYHQPGNPCPVEPRTRVVCQLRDGTVLQAAMAKSRDWRCYRGASYEIVKYRIVP